jgi:hypothetical protein
MFPKVYVEQGINGFDCAEISLVANINVAHYTEVDTRKSRPR